MKNLVYLKKNTTLKNILSLFSYIFHPIFIPLLGTFFYVLLGENYLTSMQEMLLFLQIFIVTILLPIAFYFLLKSFGRVDSIMLSEITQRKMPLLLQILLFTILITRSVTVELFPGLYHFYLGGLVSSILAFGALFGKIKVSLHMIGISALTFFIIGLSYHNQVNCVNTLVFFMVINGFVASSRLTMKAHTGKELLYGFLSGSMPQIALFYFWL